MQHENGNQGSGNGNGSGNGSGEGSGSRRARRRTSGEAAVHQMDVASIKHGRPSPEGDFVRWFTNNSHLALDAYDSLYIWEAIDRRGRPTLSSYESQAPLMKSGSWEPLSVESLRRYAAPWFAKNANTMYYDNIGKRIISALKPAAAQMPEVPSEEFVLVRNGCLTNLQSNSGPTLVDADPTQHLTPHYFDITYDPYAEATAWDDYLLMATGNEELVQFVYRLMAWYMLPIKDIAKAVCVIGLKGNGKSTFLTALRVFMDGYGAADKRRNSCAVDMKTLNDKFGVELLSKKLLCVCDDVGPKDVTDEGVFRRITGSHTMSIEGKWQRAREATLVTRLLMSSNLPFPMREAHEAVDRRLLYLVLPKYFAGRDHSDNMHMSTLLRRLSRPEALSGALNQVVRQMPLVLSRDLAMPHDVLESTAEIRANVHPMYRWAEHALERCAYVDPGESEEYGYSDGYIATDALMKRFAKWYKSEYNAASPYSLAKFFYESLLEVFTDAKPARIRVGGQRVRVVMGVRWRERDTMTDSEQKLSNVVRGVADEMATNGRMTSSLLPVDSLEDYDGEVQ